MVRVISVHHFAGQHITTVEQPTASTVAPPQRLLLALNSHCVEVRDVKAEGDVILTFPTVDEVAKIHHCLNGNYVATMETKFNRQNRELNFIRVYLNWDSVATLQQAKMNSSGASLGRSECGMVQPMRARIAGRVTPTTNQSELGSLEMIEIPSRRNPSNVEVCQMSGNILIQSGRTLNVYKLEIKTHDISKLKFIDFDELPISVELSFLPMQMKICENYIACLTKDSVHLFKLVNQVQKDPVLDSCDAMSFKYSEDETLDYQKLLRDESLNLIRDKITVNLPSIVRANSAVHKHSPFTFCDKDLTATVKCTEGKLTIENLIQLKLKPFRVEHAQKQIMEEFKCLILRPLYVSEVVARNRSNGGASPAPKSLSSAYRNNLHSVSCLIVTQQEGYMYQFADNEISNDGDNCITVYPFTAPVQKIVLEDYLLHALTDTGLETYTIRTGHKLCRSLQTIDNINVACPSVNEPVCLVGLRPFLCIEELLLSDGNLVLLANGDTSPTHSVGSNSSSTTSYWTMYNLELPTPKTVFNDISIVANSHRFTSTQTYCHLISEAHMILRLSLILNKWISESGFALLKTRRTNTEDIYEAYRNSCAMLGDHYIMCSNENEYHMAVPYYKMAAVSPNEVIRRVKKSQEQSNSQQVKGLIYYLKTVLFDAKLCEISTQPQNFAEAVLDLFERYNFQELPSLILKVGMLRDFSTDKLINILSNGSIESEKNRVEKILALTILYILKGNTNRALSLFSEISDESLRQVLLDNSELLFESFGSRKVNVSFSEFAIIMMNLRPDLLAELFFTFIDKSKVINLNKFLKVFIEYLPSSIGNEAAQCSLVLRKTLELYFKKFFEKFEKADLPKITYDRGNHEALKLLVRSYLSQLQILQIKIKDSGDHIEDDKTSINDTQPDSDKDIHQEKIKSNKFHWKKFQKTEEKYLFVQHRFSYLNRMEPFHANYNAESKVPKNDEADLVLKKLQALLCSSAVPNQVILEVNTFLQLNEKLRGNQSLQSLIMTVSDAAVYLIENCPQCVLQFGKDRFAKPDEWKFLIATIQRRILTISQNEDESKTCFYYKKLLKDVLTYTATNMNLEHLVLVFPQHMDYSINNYTAQPIEEDLPQDILKEIQDYDPYITLCKETMHANQISKLITTTAQQLLCTLNL